MPIDNRPDHMICLGSINRFYSRQDPFRFVIRIRCHNLHGVPCHQQELCIWWPILIISKMGSICLNQGYQFIICSKWPFVLHACNNVSQTYGTFTVPCIGRVLVRLVGQATIRKLHETVVTASAWIWNSRDRMETDRTWHDWHIHHHPPGSATTVLLGPPIHTTPTGIGPERRYGFQLNMVGDEQGLPCMSDIISVLCYLHPFFQGIY